MEDGEEKDGGGQVRREQERGFSFTGKGTWKTFFYFSHAVTQTHSLSIYYILYYTNHAKIYLLSLGAFFLRWFPSIVVIAPSRTSNLHFDRPPPVSCVAIPLPEVALAGVGDAVGAADHGQHARALIGAGGRKVFFAFGRRRLLHFETRCRSHLGTGAPENRTLK